MDRRKFLKTTAVALSTAAVAKPSLSFGSSSKTLRFVPQADLANFDPIWGTQYVVRNGAMLVWDTLYGVDSQLIPQRQMAESETVSADGLTWTFSLRAGLKFHDGEPVLAKDAVASLARWSARDQMGKRIKAVEKELVAVDDRTFKWVLSRPFPKMLFALGKHSSPCAFIMPERIAQTDPFKQINEFVGSGPMKFARSEWAPGARAVFEKFDGYVPRVEPASWLAGGKRMLVDRIEWLIMPDPGTASTALQNGEIDWWESPLPDLIPLLRRNKKIAVEVADPLGHIGCFRINHLQPPFSDVRVRRAVMMAISQQDYMVALVGDDETMWKSVSGFFTPGTPLYTEAGGDILKGKRNMEAAKKLLAEAGYAGEPVTCLVAQDFPLVKPQGDVTADLLRRLGMNVDFVATDWGTVGARRTSKAPASKGGWHMFHTEFSGADCINPAAYFGLRADGDKAWFGWPDVPGVEAGINAWFEASSLAEEKVAVDNINKAAVEGVVYAPTGFFLTCQAWRKGVEGVTKGPMPVFWGVSKNA